MSDIPDNVMRGLLLAWGSEPLTLYLQGHLTFQQLRDEYQFTDAQVRDVDAADDWIQSLRSEKDS